MISISNLSNFLVGIDGLVIGVFALMLSGSLTWFLLALALLWIARLVSNPSGLPIGIAGFVVGVFALYLSGSLALAMVALAVVWFALGYWWRKRGTALGVKRPFPAVLFIPLPFAAIPLALLAAPMFYFELQRPDQPPDPRAAQFRADEDMLRADAPGDAPLSQAVLSALRASNGELAQAEPYSVFTRQKPNAVLVLVQVRNLKKYSDYDRMMLIDGIRGVLQADPELKRKRHFIGIKGRILYGAIHTPDAGMAGSRVDQRLLYEFYDDNQKPAPEHGSVIKPEAED